MHNLELIINYQKNKFNISAAAQLFTLEHFVGRYSEKEFECLISVRTDGK